MSALVLSGLACFASAGCAASYDDDSMDESVLEAEQAQLGQGQAIPSQGLGSPELSPLPSQAPAPSQFTKFTKKFSKFQKFSKKAPPPIQYAPTQQSSAPSQLPVGQY
ncbi:Hypothetical protein A7982_07841 [Minicystis rosea]|nr:Hypothetical protein A7982_07841 [Minicystis rosea]